VAADHLGNRYVNLMVTHSPPPFSGALAFLVAGVRPRTLDELISGSFDQEFGALQFGS
jgi:hypothetical protein